MKERIKLVAFLFIVLLASCKKEDAADSDIEFRLFNLEKQGWKSKLHSQKIDDITFTATEVPLQYYILKELGNENFVESLIFMQGKC